MVKLPSIMAFAKSVCAVCLGTLILWQVTEHAGSSRGTVIIHVSEAHVVVSVDDFDYPINSIWELPLICELKSGRHILRMKRGERVVYREEFRVRRGEELVLTAWEPVDEGPTRLTPEERPASALPIGVHLHPGRRR